MKFLTGLTTLLFLPLMILFIMLFNLIVIVAFFREIVSDIGGEVLSYFKKDDDVWDNRHVG